MSLDVFRNDIKIGVLDIQANEPFYGFEYDVDYLASPGARPLSLSLPLVETRYSSDRAQPYFEGLLPEDEARDAIARRLGISRSSTVKLLKALGRDCAGEVTIIEQDDADEDIFISRVDKDVQYYEYIENAIQKIAENPREEIPRLQENMRLSLAGGQEKIALYHDPEKPIYDGWYIPSFGYPSTHIIKPGILETHYPSITLNEFICLRAASECGIKTADVDICFPETPILIISRYDRLYNDFKINDLKKVTRIHQEDFCQACGVISSMKYQHDGGPGFKQIRDLLVMHAKEPVEDLVMFIKWAMFNYLTGNCDAHAKNLSVLHNNDGSVELAPVYDLISTSIYDGRFGSKLSRNMGMRFGAHENIDKINTGDLRAFANDVSMRFPHVKRIGEELVQDIETALSSACQVAKSKGFTEADEIYDRIINGCRQRAKTLVF